MKICRSLRKECVIVREKHGYRDTLVSLKEQKVLAEGMTERPKSERMGLEETHRSGGKGWFKRRSTSGTMYYLFLKEEWPDRKESLASWSWLFVYIPPFSFRPDNNLCLFANWINNQIPSAYIDLDSIEKWSYEGKRLRNDVKQIIHSIINFLCRLYPPIQQQTFHTWEHCHPDKQKI